MSEVNRPVKLECGHTRWFKVLPLSMEETLWCPECSEYREIAPVAAKLPNAWVFHPDEHFKSRRHGKSNKYTGECLDCGYSETVTKNGGWFALQAVMNRHYMREHTRFGSRLEINIVDRMKGIANDPPF